MSLIGDNQKTSELQVLGGAIASFFPPANIPNMLMI